MRIARSVEPSGLLLRSGIRQQLIHSGADLLYSYRFNAERRLGDQAAIPWARIALKRILQNPVFHAPRPPSARVRRTPNGDRGRADSCGKVHRSGIIADI